MHVFWVGAADSIRDLLAEEDRGSALFNEAKPDGCEVASVGLGKPFSCDGERLARGRARPAGEIGVSGQAECLGPAADSREEVALVEAGHVSGRDLAYRARVNDSGPEVSCAPEFPEPCGSLRVPFIIINPAHLSDFGKSGLSSSPMPRSSKVRSASAFHTA